MYQKDSSYAMVQVVNYKKRVDNNDIHIFENGFKHQLQETNMVIKKFVYIQLINRTQEVLNQKPRIWKPETTGMIPNAKNCIW